MSILGLSRWNKNWNVRNNYSYVATANKIRFHFQFPRSPDAEFGGLIGWLFNWKCKFSCRIISKIANYLKYNYFWDGDGFENITSRLWKFSYFCSRHTVGVAGDDIMVHILVTYIIACDQIYISASYNSSIDYTLFLWLNHWNTSKLLPTLFRYCRLWRINLLRYCGHKNKVNTTWTRVWAYRVMFYASN